MAVCVNPALPFGPQHSPTPQTMDTPPEPAANADAAPAASAVVLHVYQQARSRLACLGMGLGLGIYHTGIEVDGTEYWFGSGAEGGIVSQAPGQMPPETGWRPLLCIELGSAPAGQDAVLDAVCADFRPETYHLFHRNCNHFTLAVATRLGLQQHYPAWVNRAASWLAFFVPRG